MKKLLIVANWKSNKTTQQAKEWLMAFKSIQIPDNKEVIICPPFTLLSDMTKFIKENSLPLHLGAQNVSSFDEGAHTGEINAIQIKEFAQFVLIGHSERRLNNKEDEKDLEKKVNQAKNAGIAALYCVSDKNTFIPHEVTTVAYEPTSAISTSGIGIPDTPQNANTVAFEIKKQSGIQKVLYGGSVTEESVNSFTSQLEIDGVLVGGASLDAQKFLQVINHA